MQLSSFLGQIGKMIEMQSRSIRSMQALVHDAGAESERFSPERLMALGAFVAWSLRDIDGAIGKSAHLIDAMLRPLGLGDDISAVLDRAFAPTPLESVAEALDDTAERNAQALAMIGSIEQQILAMSDEEIVGAYPEDMILDFQRSWEKQFSSLLEEE